jgi:hypothetical protein
VAEFEDSFPSFDPWSHIGTPATTNQWFSELEGQNRADAVIEGWKTWGLDNKILDKSAEYGKAAKAIIQELADNGVETQGLQELLDYLQDRTH